MEALGGVVIALVILMADIAIESARLRASSCPSSLLLALRAG